MIWEFDWDTFCDQITGWEADHLDFILIRSALIPDQAEENLLRCFNEIARILKPGGLLFVHGIPEKLPFFGVNLDRLLTFKYWIVVESTLKNKDKGLPTKFYCLRQSCIRARKRRGEDEKEPLTDIWWDIHLLKHRRDRDFHPCQRPDALLERIILLSTNPGDIVVDALAGTGTTAIAAAKLGRRYVAIDVDPAYVAITKEKLAQLQTLGKVQRQGTKKTKNNYTKKALQLELQRIARQLGHLPTPEEVQKFSHYELEAFLETFPSWNKALKAAKIEGQN